MNQLTKSMGQGLVFGMDSTASNRKPCVFCGDTSSKLTREHVFGNWMATAFKDYIDDYGAIEIRTGRREPIRYQTGPFTDTVRIACKSCNEGWMNDCALGVQQLLTPMMTGGFPRLLTAGDQEALASWAVKTALVLDHQTPENPIVPVAEYPELFATKRPLSSHIVWIGHTDPRSSHLVINSTKGRFPRINAENDPALRERLQASIDDGRWLYLFTFSIGFVVLQILGHNMHNPLTISTGEIHPRLMTPFWPVRGDVSWPPPESSDTLGGPRALHELIVGVPAP